MGEKWTYCAVYSIIQMHLVRGAVETFSAEEHIYALPGSDVNLTCHARKKGFLVQTQWSEVTGKADLLAVYHPEHGFSCASRGPCGSLVAFREAPGNVFEWTLHLRNVSSSTAGKYECSFTLYPEGIQTKVYSLKIQTDVAQEEWRSNHTIEIEINGTLEIPCFQNTSLDISSALTFAWLVEDHGTQETLTARGQPTSNSTLFKDRVRTGADYRLYLSPVQVHDDGRTFSCRIVLGSGRVLRSSTTVKVFAKLEIPMIVENNSMDVIGERIFTCSLRNVFPTANLSWFIQRSFPQAEREEMYTASEKRKDKDGFWELKSVLTSVYDNKPAHSNNLTIWCMALSPAPGHKVWNSSSEKITFSLGSVKPPTDSPLNATESTLGTQPSPANSVSPAASNSDVPTRGFSYSWTSSGKNAKLSPRMPSETNSSPSPEAGSALPGDIFTSTTRASSEVPTTANVSTKNNHVHITGIVTSKPKDGMSWPVIVAALLSPCLVLFGLGVRKWCQYQKEIMERPPPFKPPPPPIKYTCIQESIGSDVPCHELETL